jgi:molybdenum cofactor cytidylyltransferase
MALRIVGVVLAAGRATRFGGDKLLAPLRAAGASERQDARIAPAGATTVGVAACTAMRAALPETLAVVRPGDEAVADALRATGVRIVECARADEGMGASLADGVSAAADAHGWVIALADMPWIASETIGRVRDALVDGALLAAPFFEGRRGHPVGFARRCFGELARLSGDDGARAVVMRHATELRRIDVDDAGVLRDVDTPRDLTGAA